VIKLFVKSTAIPIGLEAEISSKPDITLLNPLLVRIKVLGNFNSMTEEVVRAFVG